MTAFKVSFSSPSVASWELQTPYSGHKLWPYSGCIVAVFKDCIAAIAILPISLGHPGLIKSMIIVGYDSFVGKNKCKNSSNSTCILHINDNMLFRELKSYF